MGRQKHSQLHYQGEYQHNYCAIDLCTMAIRTVWSTPFLHAARLTISMWNIFYYQECDAWPCPIRCDLYKNQKWTQKGMVKIAVPGEVILIEHTQNTPGPLYPSHRRILRLCALRGSCSRRCPKSHPWYSRSHSSM